MKLKLLFTFFLCLLTLFVKAQIANSPGSIATCDTNNDGFEIFDLTVTEPAIIGAQTNVIVTYHLTQADAESGTNPIITPTSFLNTSNPQTIYARVEDISTGNYDTTSFDFQVLPQDNSSFTLTPTCDGATATLTGEPGGTFLFNPTPTDGATIDPETGTVTNATQGSTYAVEYTTSGICPSTSVQSFTVISEILSVISPSPLVACDTNNDGFETFNLTSKDAEILNGLDPSLYILTYYSSLSDAVSAINSLPSLYTNTINPQTIFVRIEDVMANCASSFVQLNLVVTDCYIIACDTPQNVTYCYGDNDTTEFQFSSGNGTPLTVLFNSGTVENNFDELIIKDSNGTELYNGYGNAGDLTDLTFTSTGSTISVQIQSNPTISCVSGSFLTWDFDVFCVGTNFGEIDVNAFIDENNNDSLDSSESLFTNGYFTYEKNDDGIINTVTSTTGHFSILSTNESDTYDFNYYLYDEYQICYNVTTTVFENLSVLNGNTIAVDFPITETSPCEDIAVYLTSFVPPRPGFDDYSYLTIKNLGMTTVSGTIEFTHDALLNFDSVLYLDAGNTVIPTATGFTLDFNNLEPNEEENVTVKLYVPPTVSLGALVTNTVSYITNTNDVFPDNDTSILSEVVVGSYDPNDKLESHGGKIVHSQFAANDYLYYTIRFQNVGTADAINVRIEDALDSQLDETSLCILKSSHNSVLTHVGNQLTWQFNSIHLPSETQDEPNSHGYVYFKIKPKTGYAIGDIIPNTAEIYFDFNAPVITNTFDTEFVTTLSVNDGLTSQFSMYPNPATKIVHFKFAEGYSAAKTIEVYSIQGKLVLMSQVAQQENLVQMDVSKLDRGLYFVQLNNNQTRFTQKLIIK